MKFYLFPIDYQFEPKVFNSLSELCIYCRDNSICICLGNLDSKKTKFLCSRWSIPYEKGMYKNSFEGF